MVLDANLKNILRDFTGKLFPIDVVVGKPGSELLTRKIDFAELQVIWVLCSLSFAPRRNF